MTEVKFTHTTYNTEAFVFAEQIVAIFYLPTMKSTVLIGPGSTAIPATDTVDEAKKKIKQALIESAKTKEKKHGVSKRKQ